MKGLVILCLLSCIFCSCGNDKQKLLEFHQIYCEAGDKSNASEMEKQLGKYELTNSERAEIDYNKAQLNYKLKNQK